MRERRRTPRTRAGYRVWLAPPHERWALLLDVGRDGLRIASGGLRVGSTLVVRRELGDGLSEARVAEVVHSDGHRAGLRYLLDQPADHHRACQDRRAALRIATHGLTAWISGPVQTPAVVRDVSATGARLEPLLPLAPHLCVRAELLFADLVVGDRRARVVRNRGDEVGIRFIDLEPVAP